MAMSFRPPNFSQIIRNTTGYRDPFGATAPRSASSSSSGSTVSRAGLGAGPSPPPTTPNYQQLILSDPLYHQATLDASAAGIGNEAQRSAQTRAALINFGDTGDIQGSLNALGLDPNSPLYRSLVGDVNASQQSANDLTSAGLSTTAHLAREHAQNIDQLLQEQASRGTLRSGATGVGLGNEDLRASQAQFDARQTVLNYLAGVQAAYAQAQQQQQQNLATAAQNAATRVQGLYPVSTATANQPTAGTGTAGTRGGMGPSPYAYQIARNA